MKLPNDEIGISDILSWRDCPRRMGFGMARHTEEGELPEATNENNYYGSAVHLMLEQSEAGATDEDAVQAAFDEYGTWLEPADRELLLEDLALYHEREPLGVRTVANEMEVRLPLFEHEGRTIYFRGKLDRVYQRLDNEGVFMHRDFKSSKWPRSEEEVHKDPQMWAYNWAIHEMWPECESLTQVYDQLRYGEVPTRKNDEQRRQIKDWLTSEVKAIMADEEMEPKLNEWCPWCPIMESCPVPVRAADWAQSRIEALAGNTGNELPDDLDADGLDRYVSDLDQLGTVRKMIERYEESIKAVVRDLPFSERERLGYEITERKFDVWPPEAIYRLQAMLGADFPLIVAVRKGRIKDVIEDKGMRDAVLAMANKEAGGPILKKKS